MKLSKKQAVILSITSIIAAILLILVALVFTQESNVTEIRVSNVESDSFYLTTIYENEEGFFNPSPTVTVDGERIGGCEDSDAGEICISEKYEGTRFAHLKVNNVSPDSEIEVAWLDTWMTKLSLGSATHTQLAQTREISETVPTLERVYGRVIDLDEEGVEGSLVYITNNTDLLGDFSAVTTENGAYSMSYLPISSEEFFQDIYVLAETGETATYSTASFYNKPVADLILDIKQPEVVASGGFSLLNQVEAANSCITGTKNGGIRAQCNDKTPWVETLSTDSCPAAEHKFRLGVIKHTTRTSFHKPAVVKLKLYDPVTKTYIVSEGKELVVNNGGYVDTTKVDLVPGKTYDIHAFDGSKTCNNTDGQSPSITYKGPAKPGSGSTTTPGSGTGANTDGSGSTPTPTPGTGTGTIPQMTDAVNLCKKVGENFAVGYEIPGEALSHAAGLRMRWGLGMVTSTDEMYGYAKTVSDANNFGINMILRICYQGNCNVNSGTEYGNKIVEIYDYLAQQGTLPQNGLYILAGHNEPNVGEYRDPQEEARFVAEVIKVVDGAGILSQDGEDIKVKLIGPSMDLYRSENGQWQGSPEDPPHPLYTAQSYIDEMLKNSEFKTESQKLYGWGVNDYIDARAGGPDKVVSDVANFTTAFLQPRGLPTNVFVTELGNFGPAPDFNPSLPWSDLANTVAELDAMENVQAILLFNSLGTNLDENFSYHRELWNSGELILSLYGNCIAGSYSVPQEGTVPVNVERRAPSGSSGAPRSSSSVGISGSFSGAGASLPGGVFNGTDPCLGGICYGNQFENYAVAPGGLLNGNFEGAYAADNNIDQQLYVPQYWHAWYQNKCVSNICGTYECEGVGSGDENVGQYCRRPEYKKSEGFGNRIYSGTASAQYFTSFATHYAGLFQHVELGTGGANTIDFSASASSWSYSPQCDNDENGECQPGVGQSGCLCGGVINTFKGRIGIDPTGGIDPSSGSIVWSEWKMLPNVQPSDGSAFEQFSLTGVQSESNRITLFVATNNQYGYVNSDSYWDGAELKVNGQLAIGQASTDPRNGTYQSLESETCDENSQPGPNGDACWVADQPASRSNGSVSDTVATSVGGATGTVLGTTSGKIILPERGEFKISSDQFEMEDVYVSNFEKTALAIDAFQDLDANGVHDSDEFYIPTASPLKVEKVDDVMEINLQPGLSIVSMPLYTEDFDSAVKLVEEIAEQGGYVTSIATYRNVGEEPGWNVYNQRGSFSYSDDFDFRPGDALYVTVQEGVKLHLRGDLFASPVQNYLKQGWNLISIKGTDTTYDSKTLLEAISMLPGVSARIVSVWDTDKGRFVTFVLDQDGQQYGEIVELAEGVGIFVYIEEGLGFWIPEE